jgi:hypothetical protein
MGEMHGIFAPCVPEGRHERIPVVPLLKSYVKVERSETNPSNNSEEE